MASLFLTPNHSVTNVALAGPWVYLVLSTGPHPIWAELQPYRGRYHRPCVERYLRGYLDDPRDLGRRAISSKAGEAWIVFVQMAY